MLSRGVYLRLQIVSVSSISKPTEHGKVQFLREGALSMKGASVNRIRMYLYAGPVSWVSTSKHWLCRIIHRV